MSYIRKIKKHSHVTLMLAALVYFGDMLCYTVSPVTKKNASSDSLQKKFAGNEACRSCHNSVYDSFIHTAHYFSSRPGTAESIKGSFAPGKNHFKFNQWMEVILEKKGDRFIQTGYAGGQEFQSESMDITIGSGRKGQTYLYWKDNRLFQLPISYFTPRDAWCNSPGYAPGVIKFYRQIPGQCLECHSTFSKLESETEQETIFDKDGIIYGVNCERCHGPAADHVRYHKAHPEETTGKYIISTGRLSRQQQLDACAFCHSGFRKHLKPSFSFNVGDKLDDFSVPAYNADTSAQLDVHGNQYGLLTSSKCFKMSEMNCSSCHNVHTNEYNVPKIFSVRCMDCHSAASHNECKLAPPPGVVLSDNCIDCHMPLLPSNKILLEISGEQSLEPDLVRTHRIAIYRESTKEFLQKKKK